MNLWIALWAVTWFGGLAVFTYLTIIVTIFGAKDLVSLVRTLEARHKAGEFDETPVG